MANPEFAAGGRFLSIHDAGIQVPLDVAVLGFREELGKNLTDADAWLRYAVALSDFHWLNRDALDAVSLAIALNPFAAEYHFFRGYCHQKLCLLEEAAADLEMAWKLDANHQNAGYYLGQTYFYLAEYERAYAAFKRLMRISPPDAEWAAICNWLYLICRMLGRDEEAAAISAKIDRNAHAVEATGTLGNTWTDCQYLLSCWAYNGFISPEEAIKRAEPHGALNLWYVTMYMALFCDLNGDEERAIRFYEETIRTFAGTEITKMRTIILPRLRALTGKTYKIAIETE